YIPLTVPASTPIGTAQNSQPTALCGSRRAISTPSTVKPSMKSPSSRAKATPAASASPHFRASAAAEASSTSTATQTAVVSVLTCAARKSTPRVSPTARSGSVTERAGAITGAGPPRLRLLVGAGHVRIPHLEHAGRVVLPDPGMQRVERGQAEAVAGRRQHERLAEQVRPAGVRLGPRGLEDHVLDRDQPQRMAGDGLIDHRLRVQCVHGVIADQIAVDVVDAHRAHAGLADA